MNVQVFPRRRVFSCRLAVSLITLALLCAALAAPSLVLAAEPGETDPAKGFSEWPDDEWFVARPVQTTGVQLLSTYAPSSDFEDQTELDHNQLPAAKAHDAVAATAGRFLTATHDSVLYAFRHDATKVGLRFFRPDTANPIVTLNDLAARVTGSTDFFDIGAGDMDGEPVEDGEYREEAIVAWANPSADNKLPVSVAVLSFGQANEAAPQPTAVTTATASGKIDAASIIAGTIKPVDNALAVAVGDFNGDGVKEVAVAYLSGPMEATIDIFRYEVTRSGFDIVRTLTRVGSAKATTITPDGFEVIWNGSVSLAAGDFDGDTATGRDELALASSERHNRPLLNDYHVRLRLFSITCTDGANCNNSPELTITQNQTVTQLSARDSLRTIPRKVQIVSGVFKANPANVNRRQIAAAYSLSAEGGYEGRVRIVDIGDNLSATLGDEAEMFIVEQEQFWLAAGGFKGARSTSDPIWSLIWSYGHLSPSGYGHVYLHPATFPNGPAKISSWGSPPGDYPNPVAGGRYPVAAVDTDGDSMLLGAPVHITLYDVVNLDFLLQEPPKHAYWDPVTAQVISVSRTDDFNITMESSAGTYFSSKSTDSSDWSIGGSVGGSAKVTAAANSSVIIAGASTEASVEVAGKVAYDYQQHESEYNAGKLERTIIFSGSTNKDDYLVGRLQVLHIWRYRILGKNLAGSGQNAFFEIVIPGDATGLNGEIGNLQTDAGGLNFDWYQPTHENGNILSYPQLDASTFNPPDLGSYTIPCEPGTTGCVDGQKTVTALMLEPRVQFCDGNTGAIALNFSSESGGGSERSSSHTLAENASIKGSYKSSVSVGGKRNNASLSTEFTAEAEFHNSNSWGSASSSNFTTTSSTGIKLNRKGCTSLNAYAYYPVFYQTTDGTFKVTFAVDPLGSNSGNEWWTDRYGQLPDLALNLPLRFYYSSVSQWNTSNWMPTASLTRKQMRGFFVRRNAPNAAGLYEEYAGPVLDGETARLEARVYNYSVSQGVPAGQKVRFDYVPYDASTNRETGERVTIGTATLPALSPRQMVTASILWDTTGKSGASSQMYRIYVVLDPGNTVTEKYETESKATQFYFTVDLTHPAGGYWTSCADLSDTDYPTKNCIDPAQNNEGYGYVAVANRPVAAGLGQLLDADVHMNGDGLAALDAEGKVVTDTVQAIAGQPLQIRVTVHTDKPDMGFSHVLVFDGDPEQGGVLIAGKKIFVGSIAPEGNSAWFEWAPSTPGPHRLYAVVTETTGDAQPGNNTDTLDVLVASPGWRSLFPVIFK